LSRLSTLVIVGAGLVALAGLTRYVWQAAVPPRSQKTGEPPPAAATSPTIVPPKPPPDDRPRKALALAQHLAEHPEDRRARFALAETYFKLRDYPRSLAELKTLERQQPRNSEVFLRRAVVLKYSGDPTGAERAIRRALALEPESQRALEWLGEIYLDQGRNGRALEVFERCLKAQPDSVFALMGKGRALEQLLRARHPIRIESVIRPVERAVQVDPQNAEGLTTLARLLFTFQEKADEAEALALRAAALDPGSAQPYLILAQIALARPPTAENLQKAGEYAFQAGQRDLNDPRPPYTIGRIALQQGDVPRAVKALERSVQLGAMPESVSQLAAAYRRAGDAERATRYAEIHQRYTDLFERRNTLLGLRERRPKEVRHLHALAELYLEAGQPETAAYWLEEAKRLRPADGRGVALAAKVRALRRKGGDGPMLPIP
jgi:tetratricopeptide (TPR) repeat protein